MAGGFKLRREVLRSCSEVFCILRNGCSVRAIKMKYYLHEGRVKTCRVILAQVYLTLQEENVENITIILLQFGFRVVIMGLTFKPVSF